MVRAPQVAGRPLSRTSLGLAALAQADHLPVGVGPPWERVGRALAAA